MQKKVLPLADLVLEKLRRSYYRWVQGVVTVLSPVLLSTTHTPTLT